MNDLGIALVWLTVQVTAVALAGLVLSLFAARRTPGAGATAALTALAASIVLAATACCPLPSWWAWDATPLSPVPASSPDVLTEPNAAAAPEGLSQAPKSSPTGGIQLSALTSALHSLRRESVVAAPTSSFPHGWPTIVVAIAGIGTAFGLVRLLLGLWAVRRSVQRSRLVHESDLLRLVEELRCALRVKRPVAVRESDELTTAATVGWRKPVLLLPADWRDWTEAQRRAVVAHELAHIGRGDFAAWLLARLSVALYFWHPLVRALAARLQLQQELAADAVAAELSGGRRAYLRALAALALRADGRTHGWPAPAFLSPKNILLRRVHMLRLKDEGVRRPVSRLGRRFIYALFFALTVTASALRGPMREALAVPPPVEAAKPAAETVTPFDLTLVGGIDDKEVFGVYGFRPAALLKRPAAEPALKFFNAQMDVVIASLKGSDVDIHVEDVEQVMGRVYFGGDNQPGKRSLMVTVNVLRTTRDIDWEKLRDQYGPLMKQHQYQGETYVTFTMPPILMGLTGVKDGCLWAADRRTLLINDESVIKAQIEAKTSGKKPALPDYTAGWEPVSRGLFALALNNRGRQLLNRIQTEAEMKGALADPKSPTYHFARFFQNVSGVIVGFAGADDFQFNLRASADTPEAAAEMARNCEALVATAQQMAAAVEKTPAEDSEDKDMAALQFLGNMAKHATVRRDGAIVTVHSEVAAGFNTIISTYVKQFPQGKE